MWRFRLAPWVEKNSWRRKWQPTAVFLPGKFHEQRNLAGYSPWGHKESDMTEHTRSFNSLETLFYLFIWLHWVLVVAHGIFDRHCSMGTLSCGIWDQVPWQGLNLGPQALGAWSLSRWTTREVSRPYYYFRLQLIPKRQLSVVNSLYHYF